MKSMDVGMSSRPTKYTNKKNTGKQGAQYKLGTSSQASPTLVDVTAGLQSTQTSGKPGKQGAQTSHHSAHLPKHPYISGCTALSNKKLTKQVFNLL